MNQLYHTFPELSCAKTPLFCHFATSVYDIKKLLHKFFSHTAVLHSLSILYFIPRFFIKFLFFKVINPVFICNLTDYPAWISHSDHIIRNIF